MTTEKNKSQTPFDLSGLNTLCDMMRNSIEKYESKEALRQFDRAQNKWISYTYADLGQKIKDWQCAYVAMGLKPGSRVAILMPNSVDHVCADQAALANGLIPVPLHAIDTPGACAFIIIDSQAQALITNKLDRWTKIAETGVTMPDLNKVVVSDEGEVPVPEETDTIKLADIQYWINLGHNTDTSLPPPPTEDDLAGIVYTSGTTGRPKGVMLTHKNIVTNLNGAMKCVSPADGDIFLSFLPLSHTFERTAGYYLALATGCTIVYNRSVLLLADDLKKVRPTVIISVPRVYERIYARVRDKLKKAGGLKSKIFQTAVNTGWRDFCHKNHLPVPFSACAAFDPIIRKTLLAKVRETVLAQFGGRLRVAISGGAAMNETVAKTFCGLGLPIIQGYGMTEASPIIAGNTFALNQPNTVGRPFDNIDVRLGEGDEIQLKGPSIMKGYWNRPDDTKATFTSDGWLKTGDIGSFNEEGLLSIKGRIKEIIVTSTGEKVPPADLESTIETDPLFAQAYVIGENRPYLSLIAVVNPQEFESLAASHKLDPNDDASLNNPALRATALRRAKKAAKNFPHYALPRAVVLTREPWTIENGLLTPTLKLKRGPLSKKLAAVITRLYATHG